MHKRVCLLLVCAAVVAAFGPLSVQAQTITMPDEATAAALAQWRANALMLVDPGFKDVVAAVYQGQTQAFDEGTLNVAMQAKARAEAVAWANLDSASTALIAAYFDAAAPSTPDADA